MVFTDCLKVESSNKSAIIKDFLKWIQLVEGRDGKNSMSLATQATQFNKHVHDPYKCCFMLYFIQSIASSYRIIHDHHDIYK